jgi:hypothetical protein
MSFRHQAVSSATSPADVLSFARGFDFSARLFYVIQQLFRIFVKRILFTLQVRVSLITSERPQNSLHPLFFAGEGKECKIALLSFSMD